VEHGFHSNPTECAWLMDSENVTALADLECVIICEWLGVAKPSGGTAPQQPIGKMQVAPPPGDTLNVREQPNASSPIIGQLSDGTIIDILLEVDNGWKMIKSGDLVGYVNGKYLVEPKPVYTRLIKLTTPYMRGDDVALVQTALNAAGHDCGKADGVFGPKSKAAVQAFQMEHGLTVDGIVGPKTWAELWR
jgi:hypothetical protein